MAAPSSDQTKPSRVARRAPASQAMRACGPPMALMTSELTTNGPMPTISIMLRATASLRPRPRSRDSCEAPSWGVAGGMDMPSENNKRAQKSTGKSACGTRGVRHPANSLNPPREPFLFKILTKSVVVFCSLLLIECSHKGWQNARGVGNIVSCRCESEHQNRPSGLPHLFSARCDGTRRSLPGHHVSTLEILSAVQGRIEILHMDAQSGAEHGNHPHSPEYPGP